MQKFGKNLTRTGKSLSIGLTAPLVAIGALSVKTFAGFEQELAKVQAISGATSSQMKELRQSAEDLGATTRFAASEVAGLQLNLSKLGFDTSEILKSTGAILDLAIATGEDLAQSATVAASTIRGFGLDASEAGRVADVMAASFSSSALDLNKFQTAMATVAPVAATAGRSIEDVTGMLSVLVNAGIDASTAGTGLRNIFLDTAKMGITVEQAFEKIRSSSNKNATAMDLFGKRGATVATVLAENADAAADFTKQYLAAEGSAKRMANIMDNTLEGSFIRLKSAMESAAIAIGEELAPLMRSLADRAAALVSRFKDLEPGTRRIIVVVGALAAAIGPVLVAIGFLATNVIPGLITALAALKVAIAANPIGLLVTAVAALSATMLVANSRLGSLTNATEEFANVTTRATRNIAKEKAEMDRLIAVAKNENISKEQRIKAVEQLNRIVPEYNNQLTLETINTKNAEEATKKYIDRLLQKARVQAAQDKLVEIEKKLLDLYIGQSDAIKPSLWQNFGNIIKSVGNEKQFVAQTAMTVAKNFKVESEELENLKNKLTEFLTENDENFETFNEGVQTVINSLEELSGTAERVKLKSVLEIDPQGAVGIGDTVKALEDQIRVLELTREQYRATSEEYKNLTEAIDLTRQSLEDLKGGFQGELMPDSFFNTDAMEEAGRKMERLKEIAEAVGDGAATAFESFSNRFVNSLGLAQDGMQGFIAGLAKTVTQLIAMLLAESIALAIKTGSLSAAFSGPTAIFKQPAFIAQAISGVMSAFAAIPKFASGGLVFGPTLGLMGEYSGASTNPEVIAPLSKLKAMLGDVGGQVFIPQTVLRGQDIVISYERTTNNNKRLK